jgi:putative photosynthetic complex assembly protein
MRDALDDSHISPLAILLAGLVMALALVYVGTERLRGAEPTQLAQSAAVETRAIRFEDRADGGISVFDDKASAPFDVIAPQTGGFLRGTLRGLARARKLAHEGPQSPFILTRWADGRLSLADPQTGRDIALEPFGPTNVAVFKRLLTLKGIAP